mmetsp:Transcript_6591/g.16878  ORF Transcript_6591/g.16878 Transcript_6591/m.16878 type:complete len:271 (-) Transcript_6591:442-1254(-)
MAMPDSLAALGSSADVMALIAAALERVVRQNHDLRQTQPTSFDAVSAPSISVHRYLARIRQYTKFHDECYVVALVYLDRLFRAHKAPFLPTQHNVHRLVIASVLVASKFYDDVFHSNSFMAQVGGISVAEMNKLEIELCLRLNWELHLPYSDYGHMLAALVQPTHPVWAPWQHMSHAESDGSATGAAGSSRGASDATSSASATAPAEATVAAPQQPMGAGAAAARSTPHAHLPLWANAGAFRREPAPAFTHPPPTAAAAGTSPAASVSVR